MSGLVIVTASTNPNRAAKCFQSWGDTPKVIVLNGPKATVEPATWRVITTGIVATVEQPAYLGTVAAFKAGVDFALAHTEADIVACLHDDVEIQDSRWVEKVVRHFEQTPASGLCGFGGALGLGAHDIYKVPYQPVQLARANFRSNMVDAEVHGIRSLLSEQVACLDGFAQIGRRDFWVGNGRKPNLENARDPNRYGGLRGWDRPWDVLNDLGFVHHAYDGALGCLAFRYGWEVWYLPVRCRHYGGQTAVGDAGYQDWARTQVEGGDHGFWEQAHKIWYDSFKDCLPIRV